jgi:hypothetical protein
VHRAIDDGVTGAADETSGDEAGERELAFDRLALRGRAALFESRDLRKPRLGGDPAQRAGADADGGAAEQRVHWAMGGPNVG